MSKVEGFITLEQSDGEVAHVRAASITAVLDDGDGSEISVNGMMGIRSTQSQEEVMALIAANQCPQLEDKG